MVRRTRDKTQTSTGQPTRRRGTRAAKAIAASPPSRIRGVRVVQSVRDDPHQSPLVSSWPWDGASCRVCVCFSWAWAEIEVVNRTYGEFSPSSEVLRRKRISPVGWRGAPRNSWGQRTPRGLAGARCLWVAPTNPHGGRSNDSRVLHPRQSEKRHLRLLQLDIVVFGNVIVIAFLCLLLSGWEALYCIWLTLT